jgi:O-antigen ligase
LFLIGQFVGLEVLFLTVMLFLVGTIAGLSRGGVITPNIISLLLLMMAVGLNFDLYKTALKSIALGVNLLVGLSLIAILLKLNPRSLNISSEGYPVFLDFLGIPGRNYGIFSHPNTLGQAAALSILFVIASRRKLYLLIPPIICILKCGSRTSLIGIIAGFLVFAAASVVATKRFPRVNRMEAPLIIGTFILGIALASSLQFLSYIKFLDPGSLTGRVSIWQNSIDLFKESSLLGLGWGWERRAIDSQLLNSWSVSSHNAILEMIFSSGILGLTLFLLILTKCLVFLGRMLLVEKMILIAILVSGVSEAYIDLQYPTIQTVLFFLIALGAHIDRQTLNG